VAAPALQPITAVPRQAYRWWKPIPLLRGNVLFRQGEAANSLFLLDKGLVRLTSFLEDDREVLLRLVREGELFGDRVLLNDLAREATADALCDSMVWQIPRADFLTKCRRQPKLWNWLAMQLERRVDEAERRFQLVTFYRVEQRLLLVLAELADAFPDENDDGHYIMLSQSELAQLVGATRETTSTALNQLERRGLVILGRRYVRVLNPEHLRRAAQ
jgi:CRP-like cAMP-binding protein